MARAISFPLLLLLVIPAAYAATYTVGGNQGWDTGIDYTAWAKDLTFVTGDTLVFNYGGSHTADEVTANEYRSCSSSNPISSNANSPTTISLTTAGTRYFVCLRSNHCAQGMKLAVNVTAATGSPSPPSTSPSPPSGGATPSPPTPTTTPPSGAATTLGGGSSLIVGSLLVLAAGLMG